MIKPHGSQELNALYVADDAQRAALIEEAQGLPSLLLNSAAAANAVMLGAGYFNPLTGYMNLADALSVAENLHTVDGLFWPVPIVNLTNATDIVALLWVSATIDKTLFYDVRNRFAVASPPVFSHFKTLIIPNDHNDSNIRNRFALSFYKDQNFIFPASLP